MDIGAYVERVTETAKKYYQGRYDLYILEGLTPAEAEERADFDLIEWSKPLPLPDAPADAWV